MNTAAAVFINGFKNDIRLQYRNGVYHAALFVTVFFIIVFLLIGTEHIIEWLPVILFGNTQFSTFYFVAGLIFLEKDEGTLFAQAVSPQTPKQYIFSKSISLSLLVTLENLALVAICGEDISISLITASMLTGIFYCFLGIICALPFRNISTFILPSVLIASFASLPFIHYTGAWKHWLFYLHPLTANLYAIDAAFNPVSINQLLYILLALTFTFIVLRLSVIRTYQQTVFCGAQ